MERWECPRGLLFEATPSAALEAVLSAAAILGGHIEKFEAHPIKKDDWEERAGLYLEGRVPPSALFAAEKDRLTIIVLDLDRQPEWLQLSMKWPMDRSDPPMKQVNFIATTRDAAKVPDYVRSMFFLVRKNGRRRGPM